MSNDKTDLIEMPAMNLPEPAFVQEKINAAFTGIYAKIEKQIEETPVDLTTKKGRDAIASLAYKIAKTKTGLDSSAATLTSDQKAIIDAVNTERRGMKEELDRLKVKARKPLTDWENAEKERIADHDAAIGDLSDLGRVDAMTAPETIREVIDLTNGLFNGRTWEEYEAQATLLHKTAIEKFTADLNASEIRVKEAEELAELRRKAEEQREKEEAERAKREAAEAKDRAEIAEREAEEKRKAEAKEQAEREAEERVQAEKDRAKQAEDRAKQAEQDAKAAEEKAKADQAAAVEAERVRIEDERATIEANEKSAAEARAADLKHRKKINNAALNALIKSSEVSEDQAKMIIQAIAKGQIPYVEINY